MTNFEQLIINMNKANEEMERLAAETKAMKEDIVNDEQRRLDAFKAKLKPMLDVFYSGETPFTYMKLRTGIYNCSGEEIEFSVDNDYKTIAIGKIRGGAHYGGPYLTNIADIKKRDDWDYHSCLLKLFDNADVAVANLEQDFAKQITKHIDDKFLRIAKENDMVAAEWRKTCVSNKPFYTESWTDEDIVEALERAGKATTKKNISELRGRFIVHLQMDGVVIRNELLDDLAQEVEE